ncbi:hypothetical protein [Romboutsia maritimum]|nr:hypothetical protein [Romboutsia maritimum]
MILAVILTIGVPIIIVVGSIILIIVKIVERRKEIKEENLDKYKKY